MHRLSLGGRVFLGELDVLACRSGDVVDELVLQTLVLSRFGFEHFDHGNMKELPLLELVELILQIFEELESDEQPILSMASHDWEGWP